MKSSVSKNSSQKNINEHIIIKPLGINVYVYIASFHSKFKTPLSCIINIVIILCNTLIYFYVHFESKSKMIDVYIILKIF